MNAEPKARVKVTDARLSECLKKDGGVCPFCDSGKTECLNSESQDDVVIERWGCCTGGCPGNEHGWRQILSLSEVNVDDDDAAEGERGYSKPLPAPLPPEVNELVGWAEELRRVCVDDDALAPIVAGVEGAVAAVRKLLGKEE